MNDDEINKYTFKLHELVNKRLSLDYKIKSMRDTYTKLTEKGFYTEEPVLDNDIIGTVQPIKQFSKNEATNKLTSLRQVHPTMIGNCRIEESTEGPKVGLLKISLTGDMICGRSAQKGTIGTIIRKSDLLMTEKLTLQDAMIINTSKKYQEENIEESKDFFKKITIII